MSQPTSKPHVLIIGAGLGGLALAQALRKKGISFQIFERDSSCSTRFQGWALSLHAWYVRKNNGSNYRLTFERLLSDLRDSMKDDLPSLETVSNTYGVGLPSEGAQFDEMLNERARFGNAPETHFIRADRAKLRDWLRTDVEITWNKKFAHYEEDNDGVTAFFEDGTSVKGDILVGADGIGSKGELLHTFWKDLPSWVQEKVTD